MKDPLNRTVVKPRRIKLNQTGKIPHVEEEWRKAKVKGWANNAFDKLASQRRTKRLPQRLPPRRIYKPTGILDYTAKTPALHPRGLLNLRKA